MEPSGLICQEHSVLVHSSVQVLLNMFLYFLLPNQFGSLFFFVLPVCVCNCVLGTAAIIHHNAKLMLLYTVSLFLTLMYRTALIVQLVATGKETQQVLNICDQFRHNNRTAFNSTLNRFDWNETCTKSDQIRLQQFDAKSSLGFIVMSTLLDSLLLAFAIQLYLHWLNRFGCSNLFVLKVKYDAIDMNRVIGKSLCSEYGTFEVLDEDGSLDSDIRFLRQQRHRVENQQVTGHSSVDAVSNESIQSTVISSSSSSCYEDARDGWTNSS